MIDNSELHKIIRASSKNGIPIVCDNIIESFEISEKAATLGFPITGPRTYAELVAGEIGAENVIVYNTVRFLSRIDEILEGSKNNG